MLNSILLLGIVFGLFSCSHFERRFENSSQISSGDIEGSPIKKFQISDVTTASQSPTSPGSSYQGPTITVDSHPLVDQWIRYFQTRGRHHMERYLARSSRYGELMKRILRENGMPEDLIYIALIESGFSSRAVSHASAVGYWQFIKPTGRRYNLEVSTLVDERRDPELSTQAAAQYFKDLYAMFDSWYLAMAGYNAGENRILRLVKKYKTQDFWVLASKKRALPKETRHYVPKYIAAKLIAEDPAKYGFNDIEYEPPLEFETIQVNTPVDIRNMAQNLNMEYDDLKILNPKFKGPLAPLGKEQSLELRVPLGVGSTALAAAQAAAVDLSDLAHYRSDDIMTHKVRRGETLSSIARKYRTTVTILRDLNDIKPRRRLRIGQRLDVPKRVVSSKKSQPVQKSQLAKLEVRGTSATEESAQEEKPRVHIVQKGDTLTGISEEYEVTIGELVKLNKLKRKSVLPIGLRLKLPIVEALPSAVAEKEGDRRSPASNSSVKSVKSSNEQNSSPEIKIKKIHIVRRGESLKIIARRYRVSVRHLILANQLNDPSHIQVGQKIKIPDLSSSISRSNRNATVKKLGPKINIKKVHVVRRGESLQIPAL